MREGASDPGRGQLRLGLRGRSCWGRRGAGAPGGLRCCRCSGGGGGGGGGGGSGSKWRCRQLQHPTPPSFPHCYGLQRITRAAACRGGGGVRAARTSAWLVQETHRPRPAMAASCTAAQTSVGRGMQQRSNDATCPPPSDGVPCEATTMKTSLSLLIWRTQQALIPRSTERGPPRAADCANKLISLATHDAHTPITILVGKELKGWSSEWACMLIQHSAGGWGGKAPSWREGGGGGLLNSIRDGMLIADCEEAAGPFPPAPRLAEQRGWAAGWDTQEDAGGAGGRQAWKGATVVAQQCCHCRPRPALPMCHTSCCTLRRGRGST